MFKSIAQQSSDVLALSFVLYRAGAKTNTSIGEYASEIWSIGFASN
jgi:hypothetical protein